MLTILLFKFSCCDFLLLKVPLMHIFDKDVLFKLPFFNSLAKWNHDLCILTWPTNNCTVPQKVNFGVPVLLLILIYLIQIDICFGQAETNTDTAV